MDVRERFGGALTLDGGLASELERRGADLRDRLWSARILLEDPDLIRTVHADYFAAGADVAISASYQASFEGFAERGLTRERAANLVRRSVELAREAADAAGNRRIVAASVGPYGAVLADGSEYVGRYGLSVQELIDFHEPRIEAFLEGAPDLLAMRRSRRSSRRRPSCGSSTRSPTCRRGSACESGPVRPEAHEKNRWVILRLRR